MSHEEIPGGSPAFAPEDWASRLGWPRLGAPELRLLPGPDSRVPEAFARSSRALPFRETTGGLGVVLDDPLNAEATDGLRAILGEECRPLFAKAGDLTAALARRFSPLPEDGPACLAEGGRVPVPTPDESGSHDQPVIRLVDDLIAGAAARGASDIHIEPLNGRLRVRLRIDGALVETAEPPWRMRAAIVSRLKLLSGMSIAEKRLPQDGRMRHILPGEVLDLRVSSIPSINGESVVLRILRPESAVSDLPELGLRDADLERLEQLLTLPDGLLLVTGPTGSGKTSTLYACLRRLNESGRKLITVEDPVECGIRGVNQVQVRPRIGMTFAAALRSILRQAPNVVMIGEIRDAETASIALNAALTGHLVLSTLHTRDAAGAISRLLDLGAPRFLVSAALRAVVAQRLVRRVCPACRKRTVNPDGGAGCPACGGSGYRGRIGIFELLEVDAGLRERIHSCRRTEDIRAEAVRAGRRSLREDARRKVTAGLTTEEEVVSIIPPDDRPLS